MKQVRKKKFWSRHRTTEKRLNISWSVSCAAAVPKKKSRSCTFCFRNEQTSTSIENLDPRTIRFFLKYSNSFILFVSLSTLVLFSFARFNDLVSTYKLNCERNSNFSSFDESDILWRWIILSLSSNTCERKTDINTGMNEFSFKITLLICFSSIRWC